jgi:predicted dehydrogenase
MAKRLRYGLIGCGGCGVGKHLASYALYPDEVELCAVYDFDAAKAKAAAEQYRVPQVYATYEEMLADPRIDFVSVATPNAFHAPITIAALEAGKHVHVEKPISMNAEEAEAIVEAKNRNGKLVMVGLNNRFTELSQFTKQYVDEGHLGEVYHIRCGWRRRRGIPSWGGWFTQKALAGGGPLIDLGVHFIDLSLHFIGFPEPVSVSGATYSKFTGKPAKGKDAPPPMDVEDLAVGFVRFANGCTMSIEYSWASNVEREENFSELMGTKGGLRLLNGELTLLGESCGVPTNIVPQIKNTSSWGENEAKHFIECMRRRREPLAKPEEAVRIMRIIDGLYASAESGREVLVSPVAV